MKSHVQVYLFALSIAIAGCSRQPASPGSSETPVATTPAVPAITVTATPSAGRGAERVFEIKALTRPGTGLPSLVGLLINSTMNGANGCYLYGAVANSKMMLVNDNGTGTKPLTGASIANNQCELVQDQSSVSASGSDVIVKAHVRFKPAFAGPKKLYVVAYDERQATDGLRPAGQWEVTAR